MRSRRHRRWRHWLLLFTYHSHIHCNFSTPTVIICSTKHKWHYARTFTLLPISNCRNTSHSALASRARCCYVVHHISRTSSKLIVRCIIIIGKLKFCLRKLTRRTTKRKLHRLHLLEVCSNCSFARWLRLWQRNFRVYTSIAQNLLQSFQTRLLGAANYLCNKWLIRIVSKLSEHFSLIVNNTAHINAIIMRLVWINSSIFKQ